MRRAQKKQKMKVALVFGGTSREREVSLRSTKAIASHFDFSKYEVYPVEIDKEGKWHTRSKTIEQIRAQTGAREIELEDLISIKPGSRRKIDVAFLALHGPGGEDGTIQGMLELLNIPYTGSGVLASAVGMDKAQTKRLVAAAGVPVLPHIFVTKADLKEGFNKDFLPFRYKTVVKPNRLGSSLGVSIARNKLAFLEALNTASKHDDEIIIEPYVKGREITVPVLGNRLARCLPVVEVIPVNKSEFYDYSAKYKKGGSEHIIPAGLTDAQRRYVEELAIMAHSTLGCRGATRSDFIFDENGKFYFLEINTIPGMTPTSLVPQSAQAEGMNFARLLDLLIKLALENNYGS